MKNNRGFFVLLLLAVFLTGCSDITGHHEGTGYQLYYLNAEETALVEETYLTSYENTKENTELLIIELIDMLGSPVSDTDRRLLLDQEICVEDYRYEGSNVELNMSAEYGRMPRMKEVLVRAGLVRTLTQITGVETVSFLVEGIQLRDSKGMPIGALTVESFIENSGETINSYKQEIVILYFTDETGSVLIPERRKLYYSSNVTLEQIVIEQLLKGPKTEGLYATLPSSAKIISVTVVDKVCYVNFNKAFLSEALSIQEQIPIYSIANSIIENCPVNQVQIAIEGESEYVFRESMQLSEFYSLDRNLIRNEE